MKKLIIVRHAKSSWEFDVIDHERPLNNRGLEDANLVSKEFIDSSLSIDLVLCSDAVRTKMTAEFFISNLKLDKKIVNYIHDLYDFSGSNLINVIKGCTDSVTNLMVFGHNHAITYFVNSYGDRSIDNVPTCGVVTIEFDIENWSDLRPGKTVNVFFPRDLKY